MHELIIDALLLVASVAYLTVKFEAWLFRYQQRQQASRQAELKAARLASDALEPASTSIAIDGARPLPRNRFATLAGFGLPPERTRELVVYESTQSLHVWPKHLVGLVRRLHEQGQALGPGVVDLLFGTQHLPPQHALYFALIDAGGDGERRLVALVDRMR